MAYPIVELENKSVIVLNGFERSKSPGASSGDSVVVRDRASLINAIKNDRDAVAFVYLHGRWLPAA